MIGQGMQHEWQRSEINVSRKFSMQNAAYNSYPKSEVGLSMKGDVLLIDDARRQEVVCYKRCYH
jgi:hypothetical protein